MSKLTPPANLDYSRPEDFTEWLKRFKLYRLASKLSKEDGEIQVATLLYTMGGDAQCIMDTFDLGDDDKKKFDAVSTRFTTYFNPRYNTIHLRSVFNSRTQKCDESAEAFIRDLYKLSENCDFAEQRDNNIRDRLVVGLLDKELSQRLQLKPNLSLKDAITTTRQHENVKQQVSMQLETVSRYKPKPRASTGSKPAAEFQCSRCGSKHKPRSCPAYGKECHKCHKDGHFSSMCRSSKSTKVGSSTSVSTKTRRKADEVTQDSEASNTFYLNVVSNVIADDNQPWYVHLPVGTSSSKVKFKVDTGADVTIMNQATYDRLDHKPNLLPSDIMLKSVNSDIKVNGRFILETKYQGQDYSMNCYVANCLSNLLSRSAARRMAIIGSIDEASQLSTVKGEPATIKLRNDVVPKRVNAPHRIPFPMLEKVDAEIDRMLDENIIRPVTKTTDWCSPVVPVPKKSGQIRLCVDLREVNRAVVRESYPIPTFDELASKFSGASVFTALDARSGYHQIALDEESSLVTTFITHRGRFCYNRLPFGISCASEVFQRKMEEILDGCAGVVVYQDDIAVFGSDMKQHDERLQAVLDKIKASNLELNEEKCKYRQPSIKFLGHVFDKSGIHPDPDKLAAIEGLDKPTDVSSLRRFLGMVNYMQRYIPRISDLASPLNCLLRNDTEWIWGEPQENAVKSLIAQLKSSPGLKYYDPKSAVTLAADASTLGLGAALIQKENCISFASRSVSDTEKNYSNIERELLSLVWGCEKFDQYLRGLQSFELLTDHMPLVSMINGSDINKVPARCQRLLMRLMRYNPKAKYIPGIQMVIPDTLSRSPNRSESPDIRATDEIEAHFNSVRSNLPVSEGRLVEITRATKLDDTLTKVIEYTLNGWPKYEKEVDDKLKPFFHARVNLSVAEQMLLFQDRIAIPETLRAKILSAIHEGHWGYEKCKKRAAQAVWWPSINSDLQTFISQCEHCNKHKPANRKEPMIPGDLPEIKWYRVSTDLLEHRGTKYMVVVDCYSRYLEVIHTHTTTACTIIQKLKSIFARWGIPAELMSDNGPPYSSHEFEKFMRDYGITHITSSPMYPQSNGAAERAVQTAKKILSQDDPALALMTYRSAKTVTGYSPNEVMIGGDVRTNLPKRNLVTRVNEQRVRDNDKSAKVAAKQQYDRSALNQPLDELPAGSPVRVRAAGKWSQEVYTITGPGGTPRSYTLHNDRSGRDFRRNRRQLLPAITDKQPAAVAGPNNDNHASGIDSPDTDNTPLVPVGIYTTRYGRAVKPPSRFAP